MHFSCYLVHFLDICLDFSSWVFSLFFFVVKHFSCYLDFFFWVVCPEFFIFFRSFVVGSSEHVWSFVLTSQVENPSLKTNCSVMLWKLFEMCWPLNTNHGWTTLMIIGSCHNKLIMLFNTIRRSDTKKTTWSYNIKVIKCN
jgi:hypothetical protein